MERTTNLLLGNPVRFKFINCATLGKESKWSAMYFSKNSSAVVNCERETTEGNQAFSCPGNCQLSTPV